jgi:hypothetical protein
MTTLDYRAVALTSTLAKVERVYFVRASDLLTGAFPYAEPVVLVDEKWANRHPTCRIIEVVDTPGAPELVPTLSVALPLFPVEMRLAWEYEAARPAVIVRDLRQRLA